MYIYIYIYIYIYEVLLSAPLRAIEWPLYEALFMDPSRVRASDCVHKTPPK